MGLRIQNNIAALNTHRQLQISDLALSKSLERLSSGFRINRAADDAAGLAVSMRFRAQIRSLQQASRNAAEGNSLLQVAEGGAEQIANILLRMKELATQAASANTTSNDRTNINAEVSTLELEIDRITGSTKYGSSTLLDGSFGSTSVSVFGPLTNTNDVVTVDVSAASALASYTVTIATTATAKTIAIVEVGGVAATETVTVAFNSISAGNTQTLVFSNQGVRLMVNSDFDSNANSASGTMNTGVLGQSTFQVGNENTTDHRIAFNIGDMTTGTSGLNVDITVNTQTGAQAALTTIDNAINTLANRRADIGVTQNRFGFTIANLASSVENITASESIIRDADIAFETVAFTKNQILLQAGVAMLAQANLAPQAILGVLQ
ncbi:MAG: flagellin N-terminal helical domain-containing protein [Candidatus Brocadiales bacterium]